MIQQTDTADFRTLAIDQLRESPTNPRRTFNEAKLQELAQSIRSQGILVPLIVRKTAPETFEVVAGARRFRAAQLTELFALSVRIVELTNSEAITLQLVENAIREDVQPYEEAMAYKALLETSEPRGDVASIALKTGRSITHIYGLPPHGRADPGSGRSLSSEPAHRRTRRPHLSLAAGAAEEALKQHSARIGNRRRSTRYPCAN